MMRPATNEDLGAIEAFLSQHPETSMFLRSNLARYGAEDREARHGSAYHLWMTAHGISAVFGRTNEGFLMAQAPEVEAAAYTAFADALAGQTVAGMSGDPDMVSRCLTALGLTRAAYTLDHVEPLYRLELDRLTEQKDNLRRATDEDVEMLTDWFCAYLTETGAAPEGIKARQAGALRAREAPENVNLRLLIEDGAPVAMAALNARVGDHVQVGGVYVPAEARRAGRGRRMTAALLRAARISGANVAVLFANNTYSARSYESIGFERIGGYRVAILSEPVRVGRAA